MKNGKCIYFKYQIEKLEAERRSQAVELETLYSRVVFEPHIG